MSGQHEGVTKLTYSNIYATGLSDEKVRTRFVEQLTALRASEPRECPHRIGGAELRSGEQFSRQDPTDRSRTVSVAYSADQGVVGQAVAEARKALPSWRARPYQERAEIMQAVVPLLTEQREEIAALIAYELGKAQADAIIEITEAIDVIELSVKEYLAADGFTSALTLPESAKWSGVVFRPYGVFAAIAPFNFPVAIPITQLVSVLLTGNTAVFKPSARTPACGDLLYGLFRSAGVPEGVITLIQGDGDTGALIAESAVDGIVFTGSAGVGLELTNKLGKPPFARPVIAEMGGKNPGVVSDKSDVAAAARAVARSAFGMTGQKCTACTRAIVVDGVYDEFIEALIAEAANFTYGDPAESSSIGGPLVNESAVKRYDDAVALAAAEGRVVLGGSSDATTGNFVEPTIIDGLPLGHALTRQELFVPILSVIRVPDLESAITEANAVQFGLSAGIFTDDAEEQERFLDQIEAGIVFVNHQGGATTGVWPGNQTMAGWKASGTTGKGGFGPYYLQQFVREQSRTIY